eukprot:422648-Amphidinium_carterae.1
MLYPTDETERGPPFEEFEPTAEQIYGMAAVTRLLSPTKTLCCLRHTAVEDGSYKPFEAPGSGPMYFTMSSAAVRLLDVYSAVLLCQTDRVR